jgi:uncharacterized protein (UPF0332 family)
MFQAARAAFTAVGIHRPWWRHGSLQATFSTELVLRRKLYPASFVRHLAEAMELRHSADYNDSHAPPRRATRMVRNAEEFVSRVREASRNV